jgi:predicted transcriptional regulator
MMGMSNGLFERFFSVLPMTISSQAGKEVECKSLLDCFALLAMTVSSQPGKEVECKSLLDCFALLAMTYSKV